ncbi:MAG: N(2)-fixation sustaining protein CowN [Campylobacterales bacterium]|nr:N(2)-fixation sustaining protein CowN [Campylobacterales bacterium]
MLKKDRYITFQNIDCYQNAVDVLDCMYELFKLKPNLKNGFWIKFCEQLPINYKEEFSKDGNRDILYLVCSNVFYLSDLFEENEFQKGIDVLKNAELECC